MSSCSPSTQLSGDIARKAVNNGSCQNLADQLRDAVVDSIQEGGTPPSSSELRASLSIELKARTGTPSLSASQSSWVNNVADAYTTLAEDARSKLGTASAFEQLKAVTALAIGDHTTPERATLADQFARKIQSAQAVALDAGLSCGTPAPSPTSAPQPVPTATTAPLVAVNPVIRGAYRALATAYQSCTAAKLPAIDASTPDVEGIVITGTNPQNGGYDRKVTKLSSFLKTDYYLESGIESDSTCFDVTSNPLIYDFGGKPYATTADTSPLDFFKNGGSGSDSLGVDCSGFVFTSLAASGLRLTSGKKMKASLVYGVSAAMMMKPDLNGLSCLSTVQPSATTPAVQSGDLLATADHVLILEATTDDPLGLARAKSLSDCTSSKLLSSGFHLNVIQSAPVKGGMGIDRMRGPDYLAEETDMQQALQSMAVSACKIRFGAAPDPLPSMGRVIRHLSTPDCKDTEVPLARESCVQSCSPALSWTSI